MSQIIIKRNKLENRIIDLFYKDGDAEFVSRTLQDEGFDISKKDIETFIEDIQKKTESPVLIITEHSADLVEKNIRHGIDLQEKTIQSIEQAEVHISEIEDHYNCGKMIKQPCPKCGFEVSIEVGKLETKTYHQLKDGAMKTKIDLLKHLRSTQIKFMELAKNQILRESIIEVIKEVDPDVASEIFKKMEQKQRELGVI